MTLIPVSKARQEMKELVNRVAYGKERVYFTSYKKKLVALVPIEDIEVLEAIENHDDMRVAKERIEKAKKEGTFTTEELKKRLGLDV